jgi:hypothetical protein
MSSTERSEAQIVYLAQGAAVLAPQPDVVGGRRRPRVLDPGHLGLVPPAQLSQRAPGQAGVLADLAQAHAEGLPGLPGTR